MWSNDQFVSQSLEVNTETCMTLDSTMRLNIPVTTGNPSNAVEFKKLCDEEFKITDDDCLPNVAQVSTMFIITYPQD